MNRLGGVYLVLFILFSPLHWDRLRAGEENTPRLRKLDFTPFQKSLDHFSHQRSTEIEELLLDATITDLQTALQSGKLTSEELTLFFLSRIQRFDDNLRSFTELNPEALNEARTADTLRARGILHSHLHGIPINLKDNIDTKAPLHTTGGAEILLNHSPQQDAALVTSLRAAGAIILGKASLSEFAGALTMDPSGANAISGAGINPYQPSLEVSGSSSGSAVSTTALMTSASVGTETSGSLISPASHNGCVSMKPSLGVVSGKGVIPLVRFQDSAGPITRNVTDAAILLSALDQTDTDYTSDLKPDALQNVSVGILRDEILWSSGPALPLEWFSEQYAVIKKIDQGLQKSGARPKTIHLPSAKLRSLSKLIFIGLAQDTVGYLIDAGAPVNSLIELREYNDQLPEKRIPFGQLLVTYGCTLIGEFADQVGSDENDLSAQYQQLALQLRKQASEILDQIFAENQIDMIVSLANDQSPLYATAGYPAITIPLGLDDSGSPVGVTFIGKQGEDAKLLARAFAFEQATRYRINPGHSYRQIQKFEEYIFDLKTPNLHFGNTLLLKSSLKQKPVQSLHEQLSGLIFNMTVKDLNQDHIPEVYVSVSDPAGSDSLIIYSINASSALTKMELPGLTDPQGYFGNDHFSVTETTVERIYPLYTSSSDDIRPTGKSRQITYQLKQSDSETQFEQVQAVDRDSSLIE